MSLKNYLRRSLMCMIWCIHCVALDSSQDYWRLHYLNVNAGRPGHQIKSELHLRIHALFVWSISNHCVDEGIDNKLVCVCVCVVNNESLLISGTTSNTQLVSRILNCQEAGNITRSISLIVLMLQLPSSLRQSRTSCRTNKLDHLDQWFM